MNMQDFYNGTAFDAYKYLGAHIMPKGQGVVFRTFAPNGMKVAVIGDFNCFQETFMTPVYDGNFYEIVIPKAVEGQRYQYRIYKNDSEYRDHCDPYGFGMEVRPGSCSVIRSLNEYQFQDEEWICNRKDSLKQPVNIYEVHLGTFCKTQDGSWLTYEDMAEELVNYVKRENYNYIEFMPLSEHPLDESWGYQNTGFFSPTSRYGTAAGLKRLIDACHRNGIGVIMDCVMTSFAIDSYGLADYDGQALYEYPHKDVAVNEWGSCNFIHSRGEVRSFLQSAANYWLEEFHFDGLRFGSLERLIYWQGDKRRGTNGSAIDFLKRMNQGLRQRFPFCILMTGNSQGFPNVTGEISEGGFGFDYKWDGNWAEDILKYMAYSPETRKKQYYILPFSMVYFKDENFMLALSHDEAAHRKNSIFGGIYGEEAKKFAQARAMYMYMYAHPGKLLNFMGNEFGENKIWNGKEQISWERSKEREPGKLQSFFGELNRLYQEEPALYELDYEEKGFRWLDCVKTGNCMYAFKRMGVSDVIYAVFNFDENPVTDYILNVGETMQVQVIFSSDWEEFNGNQKQEKQVLDAEQKPGGNQLKFDVPAYTAMYFKEVSCHG